MSRATAQLSRTTEPAETDPVPREDRRARLASQPNPGVRRDYVIALAGQTAAPSGEGATSVAVRYVPDRITLGAGAFFDYLDGLGEGWASLEQVAVAVIDDLSNQLVPRWVQVIVTARIGPEELERHEVILEDRQPGWENESIMVRLARY